MKRHSLPPPAAKIAHYAVSRDRTEVFAVMADGRQEKVPVSVEEFERQWVAALEKENAPKSLPIDNRH